MIKSEGASQMKSMAPSCRAGKAISDCRDSWDGREGSITRVVLVSNVGLRKEEELLLSQEACLKNQNKPMAEFTSNQLEQSAQNAGSGGH